MLNPGNIKSYDKLWAVLSVDSRGFEGLCAINTPIGPQVAVTGDEKILRLYIETIMRGQAAGELKDSGMRIVVAEYSRSSTTDPDSAQESGGDNG